jgi:hypothetical protein
MQYTADFFLYLFFFLYTPSARFRAMASPIISFQASLLHSTAFQAQHVYLLYIRTAKTA